MYDKGFNNRWYDEDTNTGNFWSDWDGTGTYPIDGERMYFDSYPTNNFTATETTLTSKTSTTISTNSTTDTSSGFIVQLFNLIVLIVITLKKRFAKKNST